MKVPMSWFGDYTDMKDITPEQYASVLTMTGSKVEGVENLGAQINNVVTGKILEVKPHENSDHLVICQVDTGNETIQIVTGAPNVAPGQTVPVALHDSTLPGGVHIKRGKLRGVESNGMLCSHDELGLSADDLGYEPEYGILILPEDTPVGMDIKELFGLDENVVEFEITSNRPDCFSVIGLARETAASFKRPFTLAKPAFTETDGDVSDYVSVDVQAPEKCMRYSARAVKNVKIGPSPKWMRDRLKASGIRAINNIVDITNYVLLEYGQPMHAFDLRDLSGGRIIVRAAADGEVIKTLDEQDRVLSPSDLVICDAEKPVAIAGVMGGFDSEIKPDTSTVIFESATFNGTSVRLTAQKTGLRTESSSRFEKGLDTNNTIPALERACELVEKLGCGEIVHGCIDVVSDNREPKTLPFRPEKINAFLGTDIPAEDMIKYLTAIDFTVNTGTMTLTAPTFRPDIEAEADVAEEVARFYGYDVIPTTLLSGEATAGKRSEKQLAEDRLKAILTSQGMYEIYTYTFTSPSIFDKLRISADSPLRNTVRITNPLGEDTSVMRTTTLASMLEVLARNFNYRNEEARLFEIGKIYLPKDGEQLPEEPEIVTLGMYGGSTDFYDIKGIVEAIADGMKLKKVRFCAKTDDPSYHPGRTAEIYSGSKLIGILGEVHPSVSETYGIDVPCYVAQLRLDAILESCETDVKYKELPKFPAVTRDIAMLIDKTTPVADIEAVIVKTSGALLESVKLFDVYEGEQIPDGKKSVAYSAAFRAADRSLTGDEINVLFDKIVHTLEEKLGAQLR